MKTSLILASVLLSGLATSAFAHPKPTVTFSGACANGDFSVVGDDFEYINLDMNLINTTGTKECTIDTVLPAERGQQIVVSSFTAEAFAQLDDKDSLAVLSVKHRFNGQDSRIYRDVATKTGDLVSQQTAIGFVECGKPVVLRTKLATNTVKATLIQDSANSQSVAYKVRYTKCD